MNNKFPAKDSCWERGSNEESWTTNLGNLDGKIGLHEQYACMAVLLYDVLAVDAKTLQLWVSRPSLYC